MTAKQVEVLTNIAEINRKFSDKEFLKKLNGNALSFTAVKLAAMKGYLVDVKSDAQQKMFDLELAKDKAKAVAYAKAKKEHGSTAASDIKYKDPDFVKAQKEHYAAKVEFEKLKSILTDAHDLIDAIKNRAYDLQSSRKDERVG